MNVNQQTLNNSKTSTKRSCVSEKEATNNKLDDSVKRARPNPISSSEASSTCDVSTEHLDVLIVDKGDSNLLISDNGWKLVSSEFFKEILKASREESNVKPPIFSEMGVVRGHRLIRCQDKESLSFVKAAVEKMRSLWKGARLEVIRSDQLPEYRQASIFIKGSKVSLESVQTALRFQNPAIPGEDICVVKAEKCGAAGYNYLVDLGPIAVSTIQYAGNRLVFNVSTVEVNILDLKINIESTKRNP